MKHSWTPKSVEDVLEVNIDSVPIEPTTLYQFAGVYCFGKGLFAREELLGANTTYKNFNRLHKDHITISKVKGWEGAIALIDEQYEGMFLSPQYPTFRVKDQNETEIKFIEYFLLQEKIWKELLGKSVGIGARRNSISEDKFLNLTLHLPPLPEQQRIVSKIETVKDRIEQIKKLRSEQTKDLHNLLFSKYTELVDDAQWLPLKEVAPIVRREVTLKADELYPELGIRCFGKGTFHKTALTGIEVATKKIFKIKKGDLVFSNVFAWEGGIAVAKEEDDDRYGSHRFISCVAVKDKALEEFLCFHFLTSKGLEDINACSPGGAGRNKTLGLDKLMKIRVPVPSISLQEEFVILLNKVNAIKEQQNLIEKEIAELMPALLDQAFKGEL